MASIQNLQVAEGGPEQAYESSHYGFLTNEPVVRLGANVRCSVNEVPSTTASSEPKDFVPLIGSEVDVHQPIRRRNSLSSPNSSDSGLSISAEEQSPTDLLERAMAQSAIKDLREQGSSMGGEFKCGICQPARVFAAYTSLLDHLRTHTGDRPHACHLCDKRFARRNTLDRHMN